MEANGYFNEGRREKVLLTSLKAFPLPFNDGLMKAFELAVMQLEGALASEIDYLPIDNARYVAFSQDGTRIAVIRTKRSGDDVGTVELWDRASHSLIAELGTGPAASSYFTFSADSSRLMLADGNYAAFWSAVDGAHVATLTQTAGDKVSVDNLETSFDGRLLIGQGSEEHFLVVTEVDTGKVILNLSDEEFDPEIDTFPVDPLSAGMQSKAFFTADGSQLLVTDTSDCSIGMRFIRIDLATRQLTRSGSTGPLTAGDCYTWPRNISDDGTRILLAVNDRTADSYAGMVFDTATAERLFESTSINSSMWHLSPDGMHVHEQWSGSALGPFDLPGASAGDHRLLLKTGGGYLKTDGGGLAISSRDNPVWLNVPTGAAFVEEQIGLLTPEQRAEVNAERVRYYPLAGMAPPP